MRPDCLSCSNPYGAEERYERDIKMIEDFRRNGGQTGGSGRTLLLTTTGATSGRERIVPLAPEPVSNVRERLARPAGVAALGDTRPFQLFTNSAHEPSTYAGDTLLAVLDELLPG